ncbi:SDR family oxidoreductase [Candidatus Nitrosopelagicus sp.]|nr:SDR family oxidoreductase [Candidatus Nitrosopelagicus sp.]
MNEITITGSEGVIGSTLCQYFEAQNKTVNKLDLKFGHDLTDENFVKEWFRKNKSKYLINCFALNDHVSKNKKQNNLYDFSLSSFEDYMKINVISLFSVCREFARNNKNGSIINFSSTYGLVSPNPNLYGKSKKDIAYGVSKEAVINLTKYLAVHLAPKIRVNCIVPGGIKNKQEKKFIAKYSELTPMKRMMKKTELNGLIDYLCSENSSYVTGSVLVCDGGYTSW